MHLFSRLHQRPTGRRQTRRASLCKPAPRFRPRLENLEGRDVPSTLTVTNNLDSGSGSLRADIAAARSGDTIAFANGLNGRTITLTSGELDITRNLTIQGPGAGQLTISGDSLSRVFEIEKKMKVTLSGMTISNGDGVLVHDGNEHPGDSLGGGILNYGTLTVLDCTISGNSTLQGGGIDNVGSLTVTGCTISGNTASFAGGGIANSGTASISSSNLSGNTAVTPDWGSSMGGGIFNDGTLTVTGCSVSNNYADDGAAIDNYQGGTLTVTGCTVSGNTGSVAIDNNSTLTVSDSVFSGNFYGNVGGTYVDGGGNTFS
jgi:hypothetical protein